MNPSVSVIYVNFNTSDLIINSIISLETNCQKIPYEIIIVDNASDVNHRSILSEWIEQRQDNNVQIIFSSENLGFGKANNLGSDQSLSEYLFFLNPDTLIVNDVISIFYKFLKSSDNKVVACGGNLLKSDHTPNDSYGNFPGLLLELCNIGLGLRLFFNNYYENNVAIASPVTFNEARKVPYIVGATIFIRAKCFKDIGKFDERFFMYYEETDLFRRLADDGFSSYLLPQAKIIHFEGGAINNLTGYNYEKFRALLQSQLLYHKKWSSKYLMPLFKMLIFMQIIVQYAKGKRGRSLKKLLTIYFKR